MVTRSEPETALLVVDAQVGVLASVWESNRLIANIEALVGKARNAGAPILWVQHADRELKYGSDTWKLAPPCVPLSTEPVIHKQYNSSFAKTDLDQRLRDLGVERIVLAGAATNWCIRSTAYSAMDRGYDLVIASDAHSTENLAADNGKAVSAQDIVAEFNAVMRWISAPDVRIEIEATQDISF
jgi:nicotinamidase-related amidase